MTRTESLLAALSAHFDRHAASQAVMAHDQRLSSHGEHARWCAALGRLPWGQPGWSLSEGWLQAGAAVLDQPALRQALTAFIPWRKGPLVLGGVPIDSEWRSDWKWARVAPHIDLAGARVLDVGCGNGYFGWCMLAHGAESVVGIDPTPLYVMQHAAIRHFAGPANHELLALRLEDLPPGLTDFDAVFSMGVLYHRRDPAQHLAQLRERLRSGGQLVLETLILPDTQMAVLALPGRYAGMRNVHTLPSLPSLLDWLDRAGFTAARCLDVAVTTTEEQRRGEWMPFHSLADALDPADADLTVEGWPRPRRAMLIARA